MASVIQRIETGKEEAIKLLAEAVAIKSVSARSDTRNEVVRMAEWIVGQIGSKCKESKVWLEEIEGTETFSDGTTQKYPPLVFAEIGSIDPKKKTLLIYAHYDVQPAERSDGWDTDPWVLTRVGDQLRGRGSTDDKGPLVGWLQVFNLYNEENRDLPVNVKLVLEGMEESGSVGFDKTIEKHQAKNPEWWSSCDWCVVSDNYWLGTEKPCLSYGLRGVTCCELAIEGPSCDLHSGVYGGAVFQPVDDLIYVMSKLKGADGNSLIPGIMEEVAPVTAEERGMYENLTFDIDDFKRQIGCDELRSKDKVQILMDRWRNPSVSLHGIQGAYSEPGFKTVIPRKVIGKFSMRTVPNQTGENVTRRIREYVDKLMNERTAKGETSNKWSLTVESGNWFYVDPLKSDVFKAAHEAIKQVWGVEPDYTREGGSIPVTVTLSKLTKKDLCLIPMGRSDDGAHSQNEKIDCANYIEGMKVFVAFLENLKKF